MLFSLLSGYRRWKHKKTTQQLFSKLWKRYFLQKVSQGKRDLLIEQTLETVADCVDKKNDEKTVCACSQAQALLTHTLPRSTGELIQEVVVTLLLAAFILIFVRQMVFEHQVIPTGSMRPTFREMDHVIVSKTAYGLNSPFGIDHLSFDPSLLKRGQIVTLTSENLPFIGQDALHFGLIKGKKRFVKRLVATMGDRVWFYGGRVWVLPSNSDTLVSSETYVGPDHDYVPFHHFFGTLEAQGSTLSSLHFRKPVHTFEKGAWNRWSGDVAIDQELLPWGMQHYAMARLLTAKQLHYSHVSSVNLEKADYYLELSHSPTIFPTALTGRDSVSPFYVYRTLLPLFPEHIKQLKKSLYTSRFVVQKEKASLYHSEGMNSLPTIDLPGVADGIYEFQKGLAYLVAADGGRSLLTPDHALYQNELLPILFNAGVHWSPKLLAQVTSSPLLPYRYVYYDHGALKCMGGILMDSSDSHLENFIEHEKALHEQTSFYPAFIDPGAPTPQQVKEHGLAIGDQEVLVLGDNHSNSGDGRDFGPVPLKNIQGSPSYRIWPPSSIFEGIDAPARPFNRYDGIVCVFFILLWTGLQAYERHRFKKALRNFQDLMRG